jgi:hypothetical protein
MECHARSRQLRSSPTARRGRRGPSPGKAVSQRLTDHRHAWTPGIVCRVEIAALDEREAHRLEKARAHEVEAHLLALRDRDPRDGNARLVGRPAKRNVHRLCGGDHAWNSRQTCGEILKDLHDSRPLLFGHARPYRDQKHVIQSRANRRLRVHQAPAK